MNLKIAQKELDDLLKKFRKNGLNIRVVMAGEYGFRDTIYLDKLDELEVYFTEEGEDEF